MLDMTILPLKGLPDIPFGSREKAVVSILGSPIDSFPIEEGGFCYRYVDHGIAFFFSEDNPAVLESIEVTNNSRSKLWGQSIFPSSEKKIRDLLCLHTESVIEEERSGDSLTMFIVDHWIHLFFEKGDLQDVHWSVGVS